jgi:hypothetical protein
VDQRAHEPCQEERGKHAPDELTASRFHWRIDRRAGRRNVPLPARALSPVLGLSARAPAQIRGMCIGVCDQRCDPPGRSRLTTRSRSSSP